VEHLLVWILVGIVAGFLAGKVMTGHGFGLIVDLLVGIVGAFIGGYLAGQLGLAVSGIAGEIVVAFVGAVILLLVLRLLGAGGIRRRRVF
jgi:uncharacterized membrane protein YeaQ/YmgE (transglycosylase-associated protein family)